MLLLLGLAPDGQVAALARAGIVALLLFAWLLTRVDSDAAGRAYATYGGVYIVASILWLWLVEHRVPDQWDLLHLSCRRRRHPVRSPFRLIHEDRPCFSLS